MTVLTRLCFIPLVLASSLTHAASLDVPSNGDRLSGIGIIHGWKCTQEGEITIAFNDGAPIPASSGAPRGDTRAACRNEGNNGFYTFWNWALLGDGEHTAIAYDNGVEFARSTFTVTTTGEEFLTGAHAQVLVEDFPSPGETTVLEWNQSTQHFEMVNSTQPDVPASNVVVADGRHWGDDPYVVNSAAVDGHRLTIEVSFGGGCRRHDFTLVISKTFLESDPVQLPAVLAHDANGDPCEAYLTESHVFDLALVSTRYRQFYGAGPGGIILRIAGVPGDDLVYEFDE